MSNNTMNDTPSFFLVLTLHLKPFQKETLFDSQTFILKLKKMHICFQ
jgi:hypothetical protein